MDGFAESGIAPEVVRAILIDERRIELYWNAQVTLVSESNAVYIYTDYQTIDGHSVAGIKVGDGMAYVIDLPFLDTIYARHIQDEVRHITQSEREFWNNKNRAYMSLTDTETLILTAN